MIRRVFLGLIAAGATIVAQSAQAKWIEARTEHFAVYGDLSEREASDVAVQLERFDHLLRQIANLPSAPESESDKVTVFLVPFSTVQSLAHSSMIGGFYASDIQSTLAVMPESLPDGVDAGPFEVMFHEYTHHIFISSADTSYPSWVEEGLAEFFGTTRFRRDGTILIGAPPQMRGQALHRQVQMNIEELLSSDGKKLSDAEIEDKYARGWLLTHYLLLGGKRPKQYDAYLKLMAKGVPSLDAARQVFGDLRTLGGELERYNRGGRFQAYAIPADFAPPAPKIRALSPCEARIMPTRMRSAVGVNEKTAPQLVGPARAVAAECPNDAFVQRSLAEVEFDAKNNNESMAAADRALAVNPNELMAMIYKGRVFAREGRWDDARKWFIKANHLNPNYALPLVLYYDSFMRAGVKPPEPAINGLMRAMVLSPRSSELRLRVAYELIKEDDLAMARKILAPVAFAVHGAPDKNAVEVLKKIDAKAPASDILSQATAAKWNEIGKE